MTDRGDLARAIRAAYCPVGSAGADIWHYYAADAVLALGFVRHNAPAEQNVRHNRKPLTPREQAVFDYLTTYTIQHRYAPSYRELGDACGLASTSSVAFVLRSLEGKGYVTRGGHGRARTIGVIEKPPATS